MLKVIREHKWFFISLICALLLAFFRFNHGIVQQDNYVSYASYLPAKVRQISFYDSRLFPGLPILVYLTNIFGNLYLSGYAIVLAAFCGSYFLLYKMTGSKLSFFPLIFPPILLNLASLIDTEIPFIFLTLLSIFFFKKERYRLSFLIIGISIWFRLVGVAVLAGIFVYLLLEKRLKTFFLNLPYFALPVTLFLLYNNFFYGSENLFYQLFTYEELHPGRISFGILQLGEDLIRAYRWGWYRILFSGFSYIVIYIFIFTKLLKSYKNSLEFWIISFIYLFILSVNLVPFLENLGRYLAPTIPLFWIVYSKKFKASKILYLMLPLSILVVML